MFMTINRLSGNALGFGNFKVSELEARLREVLDPINGNAVLIKRNKKSYFLVTEIEQDRFSRKVGNTNGEQQLDLKGYEAKPSGLLRRKFAIDKTKPVTKQFTFNNGVSRQEYDLSPDKFTVDEILK